MKIRPLLKAKEFVGWKETEFIKSNSDFLNEIKKSLKSMKKKGQYYSLEELFGD